MGCGDPNVGTPQCPGLQQFYNKIDQTKCGRKPRCPGPSDELPLGWSSYHKFCHDCPLFQCQRCCVPTNPPHDSAVDFQCCTGQITGDARKGTCNAESCPYSTWCNQNMIGVCSIPGNLNSWFSKNGNCGTYARTATNLGGEAQRTGATMVRRWAEASFNQPYNPKDLENIRWKKKVYVAKNYCPLYPGACDGALETFCSTVTRKDVVQNPDLEILCGCFMPPEQYPYRGFVDWSCSQTCNGQDNIKRRGWKCNQTVCIIDDVDINMIDSEGNINLNQICGNTSGDSVCLLKDVNVNEVNSRTGGGVQVNQQCKKCYKWVGSKENEPTLLSLPGNYTSEGWKPPPGWVETPCTGRGGTPFSGDKKWVAIGIVILLLLALVFIALVLWFW